MEVPEDVVVVNTSRLKSVVWKDFDRVKKGETFSAICRHCKRILSGSSTSGTSHLRNHLIRCRRRSNHDISQYLTKGRMKQSTLSPTNLSDSQVPLRNEIVTVASTNFEQGHKVGYINRGFTSFDHRQSQLDLARMIIIHGYPIDIMEDPGFKLFVRNLQPLFELTTLSEVQADCKEIYRNQRQRIFEELDKLPGKVSLSADRWVTKGNTEYLSLTAHYIDSSWELKKKVLNFLPINRSQSEYLVSELIMGSIRNWNIDRKVFSLTISNCASYDNMICKVRDELCQHKLLMCEGQLFDVRCAASTLTLLVQDVLDSSHEIINKVREIIQYVKRSLAMQEKFEQIVQLVGVNSQKCLSTDNPSNWNSTYLMLEAALEYREALCQLQEQESTFLMCPSSLDWDRVRAITCILKFVHEVSNVFGNSMHSTANSYFAEICDIHLQLIEWCQKSDDFISSLALKLKSKFDEYWKKCSLIMAVAAVLDPRFKMKLVEYYYPQIYGDSAKDCIDIVSNCMKALYNGHAVCSAQGHGYASESGGSAFKDRLSGFDKFIHDTSLSQNSKSDLDKYLEEPLFPRNVDFRILNWWKVHEPRYPVLSMMARNILGIPLSKADPESIYDTGDTRSLNHSWSSLNSDIFQALMCSRDWMRDELRVMESNSSPTPPLAVAFEDK